MTTKSEHTNDSIPTHLVLSPRTMHLVDRVREFGLQLKRMRADFQAALDQQNAAAQKVETLQIAWERDPSELNLKAAMHASMEFNAVMRRVKDFEKPGQEATARFGDARMALDNAIDAELFGNTFEGMWHRENRAGAPKGE